MPADRNQIAGILHEIGRMIEVSGGEPFRSRAFYRAARCLETLPGTLEEAVSAGRLRSLPGIGPATEREILAIYREGFSPLHRDLRARLPRGILELLRIPGVGPAKLRVLYRRLGVTNLGELEYACQENRLLFLPGFGKGTQEKIFQGIQKLRGYLGRLLLPEADLLVRTLLGAIRGSSGVGRAQAGGAVRRREEVLDSLELIVELRGSVPSRGPALAESVGKRLRGLPEVSRVRGGREGGIRLELSCGVSASVVPAPPREFPFQLLWRTGNEAHRRLLVERAGSLGLRLGPRCLLRDGLRVPCGTEEEIFARLGLQPIPPEIRQGHDEVRLALEGRLPRLIRREDLRGTFHVHTVWSDGGASVQEMAAEAERLGFEYLGIADHSRSARIANGLSAERLLRQIEEIDRWNRRGHSLRVLKGSEVDILRDGSLDFGDEILSRLDFVIASVHTRFRMDRAGMTERILRAMENPYVTVLGHPTGRLLLAREPFDFDMDRVLRAAAMRGILVELNANPRRLDLRAESCRPAAGAGVRLSINPDAHSREKLRDVEYGISQARRGWLRREDVWNCLPLEEILKPRRGG